MRKVLFILFLCTCTLLGQKIDLINQTKSSCTAGWVFYGGTSGKVACDGNLTWDGTTLYAFKGYFYNTTPTTGISSIVIRQGAGQGGSAPFYIVNNANDQTMNGFTAAGGIFVSSQQGITYYNNPANGARWLTLLANTETGSDVGSDFYMARYSDAGAFLGYPFWVKRSTGIATFSQTIAGSITGNAGTASALAANGANCSAGYYPLGVDASGAVEGCTVAGSGGGATRYELEVTRTGATTLTINPNCSGSTPCNIKGNQFTSAATVNITAGSASDSVYIYLNATGAIIVGYNAANTYACSGCTSTSSITSFPSSALPGYVWPVTTATFDTAVATFDKRSFLYEKENAAGSGIAVTDTYGKATIAIDTAVVPFYSTGAGVPSGACTAGTMFYLDTTSHNGYYCTDTNTWEQIDGAGGGGGYTTIDDEDTPLTQRTTLNFEGAGVTCADDTDQTTCTIPGGSAYDVFDWTVLELRDDLVGCTSDAQSGFGHISWRTANYASGNGAGPSCEAGEANHPWTFYITSGTTQNGGRALYAENAAVVNMSTNYTWQVEWIVRTETTANKNIRIGLVDAVNADNPANRITWRYEAGTDTYFTLEACSSSTCSTQASAITPSDTWHRFKIWGTASGTVKGCIDACGSDFTISTNVPTANLYAGILFTALTTDNGWLKVDAFAIKRTGLSRW